MKTILQYKYQSKIIILKKRIYIIKVQIRMYDLYNFLNQLKFYKQIIQGIKKINQYSLLKTLGRGSYGKVKLAMKSD